MESPTVVIRAHDRGTEAPSFCGLLHISRSGPQTESVSNELATGYCKRRWAMGDPQPFRDSGSICNG
jgi:hypothetical protein